MKVRAALLVVVCVGLLGACSSPFDLFSSGGELFIRKGDPLGCSAGHVMRVNDNEPFALDESGEITLIAKYHKEDLGVEMIDISRVDSQGESEDIARGLERGYSVALSDAGVVTLLDPNAVENPVQVYVCFEPEAGFVPSDFVVTNEHGLY